MEYNIDGMIKIRMIGDWIKEMYFLYKCMGHLLIYSHVWTTGFGFLSFEDEDAVDRCVAEHFVNLNGKQV